MNIHCETILGIRILLLNTSLNYEIKHEFVGLNWRLNAAFVLPYYKRLPGVKIQTLHHFGSSYNLFTGAISKPMDIWFDNHLFFLKDSNKC